MPAIIKNSSVRATHPGAGFARASATRACEKSVELLRQGGVVHALQLTCSCGEATVVELDYPQTHPQTQTQTGAQVVPPEESTEVSA